MAIIMGGEMTSAAVIASSVGLLAVAALVYMLSRSKQPPQKRTVGKVSTIRLYPIKSCQPLYLTTAQCTETGLQYKNVRDRQFLLVGEKGFINVKVNIKLLDVKVSYEEDKDQLLVQAPGMSDLTIPLKAPVYDSSKVKSFVWFDERETFYLDCGSEYSDWFTEYLGQQCALGYAHDKIKREVNPIMTYNKDPVHPDTRVLFNNTHPYLLANQASLDDLNTRLQDPVKMDPFRPNIDVAKEDDNSALKPYEEDDWRDIYIGDSVKMYNSRICPRCPMIYVDYDKKEVHPNKEPMSTLIKYRRGTEKQDRAKTIFGINTSIIKPGQISCGDVVVTTSAQ